MVLRCAILVPTTLVCWTPESFCRPVRVHLFGAAFVDALVARVKTLNALCETPVAASEPFLRARPRSVPVSRLNLPNNSLHLLLAGGKWQMYE